MKNYHNEKYLTSDLNLDLNENLSCFDILSLFLRVSFSHSYAIKIDHKTMLERDNAFWVVTKMKYVLLHPMGTNLKLNLKTWAHTPQAVRFMREYEIKNKNQICVQGLSEWCCLDYQTRKLRKSSTIKYPKLKMKEKSSNNLTFSNLKLDVNKSNFVYTKTIQSTDIDVNLHTNNLKYSIMALNALTIEELSKQIAEYEIYFVNETKLGDKIDIYKIVKDNIIYVEGIIKEKTIFRTVITIK